MKTLDQLATQISHLNKQLDRFVAAGDVKRAETTKEMIANVLCTGNQLNYSRS